ncbi:MAG: hypothetical protein Q4C09_04650 [Atopobiaceae bacterium]|nr:hypothetical protein [Atopobiaceae bacterium]
MFIGIIVGVAVATPMLYELRKAARAGAHLDMGELLVCCLAPFMALQLLLLAVWLVWPSFILGFGAAASLTFLATVTCAILRDWLT